MDEHNVDTAREETACTPCSPEGDGRVVGAELRRGELHEPLLGDHRAREKVGEGNCGRHPGTDCGTTVAGGPNYSGGSSEGVGDGRGGSGGHRLGPCSRPLSANGSDSSAATSWEQTFSEVHLKTLKGKKK